MVGRKPCAHLLTACFLGPRDFSTILLSSSNSINPSVLVVVLLLLVVLLMLVVLLLLVVLLMLVVLLLLVFLLVLVHRNKF